MTLNPTLNKVLLLKAVTRVTASAVIQAEHDDAMYGDPEYRSSRWNQAEWRCGSGMCFAGHTVDISGRVWLTQNANLGSEAAWVFALPTDPVDKLVNLVPWDCNHPIDHWFFSDCPKMTREQAAAFPPMIHVKDAARTDLGLNERDAVSLFSGSNRLDELLSLSSELIEADIMGRTRDDYDHNS